MSVALDFPVMRRASPPTANPIPEPETAFQNIQVPPQPGVASTTKPRGSIMRAPHSGPRKYHCAGTTVTPTTVPIITRAR